MIYNIFSKFKIEKDDLRFFFPLGWLAGLLIEITSFLPDRVNRGLFSDVISDHLPWATITIILIIQAMTVLFYHLISKPALKKYAHDLVEHAAKKIGDFCSPAFSIMLGLSFACTTLSCVPPNIAYLDYSFAFGAFSLFFIAFIFISEYFKKAINSILSDSMKELSKSLGVGILMATIIAPLMNKKPIEILFTLPIGQYELLEKAAQKTNQNLSVFSKDAVVSKSIEVVSDK